MTDGRVFRTLFLSGFLLAGASAADGRALSQGEVLDRCYTHLTGERLSPLSPYRAEVKNGRNAVDICLKILDETSLGDDGLLATDQSVQRRILKQFNDLHHSWFTAKTLKSAELVDFNNFTMDLYDASEGALFYTRALFSPKEKVSSVLTTATGMEAIRDINSVKDPVVLGRFPRPSRAIFNNTPGDGHPSTPFIDAALFSSQEPGPGAEFDIPAPLVQIGELHGVRPRTAVAQTPVVWTDVFSPQSTGRRADNSGGLEIPHDIFRHYGGGALGTQSYLMMNFGHGYLYQANGATKLPRKWMQSALEDFLCRKTPVLRERDVLSYVRVNANAPAFRGQSACLRCHATLDQGALVLRNLKPVATHSGLVVISKRIPLTMAKFAADESAPAGQEFWPAADVGNFHRQPAAGELYFRSISGALVQARVNSLSELGGAMAGTDDFYTCAASRYFAHFTGIRVPLVDEGDPASAEVIAAMSDSDRKIRKLVRDLGQELKQHQSLREIIRAIMKSPNYQLSDFGHAGRGGR